MINRLIIKGTIEQAEKAAQDHGFKLLRAWAHSPTEVHAYADCESVTLANWLAEPPLLAPFPPGALLHYSDGISGGCQSAGPQ